MRFFRRPLWYLPPQPQKPRSSANFLKFLSASYLVSSIILAATGTTIPTALSVIAQGVAVAALGFIVAEIAQSLIAIRQVLEDIRDQRKE